MAILDYEYDEKTLPKEVKRSLDFLYEAADRKEACPAWVGCFSENAKVVKGPNEAVGKAAVLEFIEKGWENVKSRNHDVKKVQVLTQEPLSLRVEGFSYYERPNGEKQTGKWTAEQEYVEEDDTLKIGSYKIQFAWQ